MKQIEKRADKEIQVVKNCTEHYALMTNKAKSEFDQIGYENGVLVEKFRRAYNQGDRDEASRLKKEVESSQKRTNIYRRKYEIISKTHSVLQQFYDLVLSLKELGHYELVVKCIPERKLPRWVRNPDKMEEVYELVTKLYKRLSDQTLALAEKDAKLAQELKRIDQDEDNYNNLFINKEEDLDAFAESLNSKIDATSSELETESIVNRNRNKA